MPSVEVHCLFLFDNGPEEYESEASRFRDMGVVVHYDRNKHRLGPGCYSPANGCYYTEYLNYFSQIFKDEKKVLAMDEDVYFTTGETLRWMNETEFDLAWAPWWIGVNAAILGINFQKLGCLFPLPEKVEYIEAILRDELHKKAVDMGADIKLIPTRNHDNYFGDGSYTNDTEHIRRHLIDAKIIQA